MKANSFKSRELQLFIVILLCISWIKSIYFPESAMEYAVEDILHYILIQYNDEIMVKLVWMTPILLLLFITCKNGYFRLMNFEVRYKNRQKNVIQFLKEHVVNILLYTIISVAIQYICFCLLENITIIYSWKLLIVIIEYYIEMLAASLSVILLAVLIKNYVYSFIIHIVIILLLLEICRFVYVPFASIFVSYDINLVSILFSIILICIIYKVYKSIEFWGGKNR